MLGERIIMENFISIPINDIPHRAGLPMCDVKAVLSGDLDAPLEHYMRVSSALGIQIDLLARAGKEFISIKEAEEQLQKLCEARKTDYTSAKRLWDFLLGTAATQEKPSESIYDAHCIYIDGNPAWYEKDAFNAFCKSLVG